jgi:hypothetical protein
MSFASAASSAPRKEDSSQGCATIVGTGGFACAAAIRRSYFDAIVGLYQISESLTLAGLCKSARL